MGIYQQILRPLVFRTDAEWAHSQSLRLLETIQFLPFAKNLVASQCQYAHPWLQQELWGLTFPNLLGVAAGLDKQGQGIGMWEALGFGFAEIGTVTRHPQPGNPTPRLFRLPEDAGIINRMGFNNGGAEALAVTLQQKKTRLPLGINLGKSKITALEDAVQDYVFSFQTLYRYGDYFVINVSSPNTPGLRELQKSYFLRDIFSALQAVNTQPKPLLVKIAPDLEPADLDDIVSLVLEFKLAGIIATNTTIARPVVSRYAQEAGGLSGRPLIPLSTQIIHQLWQRTQGQVPIIGVGGIYDSASAWEKIIHGATLLQLYTGWVYEGPLVVRQILAGLVAQAEREGFSSLSAAIGSAHR
jgi:dihydroorotate dehydrogenase